MSVEGFPNEVSCRVVDVSSSGFYAWRSRPLSAREVRHAWLTDVIRDVHTASQATYGARRVHAELTLGRGIAVGHNGFEMLMQRAGLYGLSGGPKRRLAPQTPTADDLVDGNFLRTDPDRLWVTDITEHPTREGKGVLCCGPRYVLKTRRRLVDRFESDGIARDERAVDGYREPSGHE